MFVIPISFAEQGENYITLYALNKFTDSIPALKSKELIYREDYIKAVEEYARFSDSNKEMVLTWLDKVLKEGIKDIYVYYLEQEDSEKLYLKENIHRILEPLILNEGNRHICENRYSPKLQIVRYELYKDPEEGDVISVWLGKLVHVYERGGAASSIIYPTFVDLYIDKGIIIARGKSKANMYEYMEGGFNFEKAVTTRTRKEIERSLDYISESLAVKVDDSYEVGNIFRKKLYKILDEFTETPDEIKKLMDSNAEKTKEIANVLINDICELPDKFINDVISDFENMVEKYFSINYPDKSIFTTGRNAYPLMIAATDEEESKVEQVAGLDEPLQSKAVFFDNKKMMQKSELCDGVVFMYYRLDNSYANKSFKVKVTVRKDFSMLKFTEYTSEEDIKNVIFSFVNS